MKVVCLLSRRGRTSRQSARQCAPAEIRRIQPRMKKKSLSWPRCNWAARLAPTATPHGHSGPAGGGRACGKTADSTQNRPLPLVTLNGSRSTPSTVLASWAPAPTHAQRSHGRMTPSQVRASAERCSHSSHASRGDGHVTARCCFASISGRGRESWARRGSAS